MQKKWNKARIGINALIFAKLACCLFLKANVFYILLILE